MQKKLLLGRHESLNNQLNMAVDPDNKSRLLVEEIKQTFIEIYRAPESRTESLIMSVIRSLSRLATYNRAISAETGKIVIDLKNLLASEKEFRKINAGKSSENAFGDSFLKSLKILEKDIFHLLEKIS